MIFWREEEWNEGMTILWTDLRRGKDWLARVWCLNFEEEKRKDELAAVEARDFIESESELQKLG